MNTITKARSYAIRNVVISIGFLVLCAYLSVYVDPWHGAGVISIIVLGGALALFVCLIYTASYDWYVERDRTKRIREHFGVEE